MWTWLQHHTWSKCCMQSSSCSCDVKSYKNVDNYHVAHMEHLKEGQLIDDKKNVLTSTSSCQGVVVSAKTYLSMPMHVRVVFSWKGDGSIFCIVLKFTWINTYSLVWPHQLSFEQETLQAWALVEKCVRSMSQYAQDFVHYLITDV